MSLLASLGNIDNNVLMTLPCTTVVLMSNFDKYIPLQIQLKRKGLLSILLFHLFSFVLFMITPSPKIILLLALGTEIKRLFGWYRVWKILQEIQMIIWLVLGNGIFFFKVVWFGKN